MATLILPSGEDYEDDDAAALDLEGALLQFGPQGHMVSVYNVDRAGKRSYVGKIPASDFSWEEVRARYGGGKEYFVQIIERGPRGQIKRDWHGTCSVEKTPEEIAAERAQAAPPPAHQALDPRDIADAVARAMQPIQDEVRRLTERAQAAPQQTDPNTMITTMVAALVQMQQLVPPAQAAAGLPVKDLGDVLRLVQDLRNKGSDNDDPIALLRDVLNDYGKPLLEAAQRSTQQPPNASDPQPDRPRLPVAQQAPEQPGTQKEQTMIPIPNDMQETMIILLRAAERDADPGNYVGIIIDDVLGKLPEHLVARALEDPVANLALLDQRFKNYEAWIVQAIEFVKQELEAKREEASHEQDDPPQPAAGADAGG